MFTFCLRSLISQEIVDKCGQCDHNCGCRDSKNLGFVAEITVFLKPWWYQYSHDEDFVVIGRIRVVWIFVGMPVL